MYFDEFGTMFSNVISKFQIDGNLLLVKVV